MSVTRPLSVSFFITSMKFTMQRPHDIAPCRRMLTAALLWAFIKIRTRVLGAHVRNRLGLICNSNGKFYRLLRIMHPKYSTYKYSRTCGITCDKLHFQTNSFSPSGRLRLFRLWLSRECPDLDFLSRGESSAYTH